MNRLKFLIYGLLDPETEQIRYVGRSSSGLKRPGEHLRPHKLKQKSHKSSWVKSLLAKGIRPEIVILESSETQDSLNFLEQKWISGLKNEGHNLVNHTNGGDGTQGFRHSESAKAKISEALRKRDPQIRQRMLDGIRESMKNESTRLIYAKARGQKPFRVFDSNKNFIGIWESQGKCCRDLGLDPGSVSKILNGKWHHTKGFSMRYEGAL